MRQGAGMARGERGAVMIFVLMMIVLICALTIGVMRIIGGGVAGGAQSLDAEQVFNIARAALHQAPRRACLPGRPWPGPRSPAAAAAGRRSRAAPPRTPPSRSACP